MAMSTAEAVYRLSDGLPKAELYGLTSQLRRAAVSIAANIAEGYARSGRKEYLQFLSIAQGSQAELTTLLLLVKRIYPEIEVEVVLESNARVGRMLTRLRQSLTPSNTTST